VDRKDRGNSFEFNDRSILDEQVDAIAATVSPS